MKTKIFFTLFFCIAVFNSNLFSQNIDTLISHSMLKKPKPIIIECDTLYESTSYPAQIEFSPIHNIGLDRTWQRIGAKKVDKVIRFTILVNQPIFIKSKSLVNDTPTFWIMEPGDSIKIGYWGNQLTFAGKGYEKLKLSMEINALKDAIKRPKSRRLGSKTQSLKEFLEWDIYLNLKTEIVLRHVDFYKQKISTYSYFIIRSLFIKGIEQDRMDKFWHPWQWAEESGLTYKDVIRLYDSCFFTQPAKWLYSKGYRGGFHLLIAAEVFKHFNYDRHNDSLTVQSLRRFSYFNTARRILKGDALQHYLIRLMTLETISEIGFTPETEKLLELYYANTGYPEQKAFVRNFESKSRELRTGQAAPDFILHDTNGLVYSKDKFFGHVTIIDFWFTGCAGCLQSSPVLKKLAVKFKDEPLLKFASVSIDKDTTTWLNSIRLGTYTTEGSINLHTGSLGKKHPVIKAFNIASYPSLFLLNPYGKVVLNPLPEIVADSGVAMAQLLEREIVLAKDGPYIINNNQGEPVSYTLNGSSVEIKTFDKVSSPIFKVPTGINSRLLEVQLKQKMNIEPCEYQMPNKLLAISDIEGEFTAFTELLLANKVIDSTLKWTFGNGHLVINGDIFDRGRQVTECLWLVYSLEAQAEKVGGYVHFILGNHEIMNLNGDHRYTHEKYRYHNNQNNELKQGILSTNCELGRWLRTKNIIERIGDILFVHGGISKEINAVPLGISEINSLARQFYDKETLAQNSLETFSSIIFNNREKYSPFWYRNYYLTKDTITKVGGTKGIDTLFKSTEDQINNTLSKFNVNRIITGHTIVADTITMHFGNKVININTPHARGSSEALAIDETGYYRVDAKGERHRLITIIENKRVNTTSTSKTGSN